MPLGRGGVTHPPQTVLALHDPPEAVIDLQRISTGGDEIDHLLEVLPRQVAIGAAGDQLVIQFQQVEGLGAGQAHDVLGQDIQGASPGRLAVEPVLGNGFPRRLAFQHFKPVGRDEEGLRRLVQPVIGPADPLDHAAGALGRGQLDDQVHISPVYAKVEGGCADHGPQLSPGHGRLDLAPLFSGQGAMMQGYGQVIIIDPPEFLEGELGLEAGVHEDQGRAGALDGLIDLFHSVLGGMPGPGHPPLRQQHVHHRLGARRTEDQIDRIFRARHFVGGPSTPGHPASDDVRVIHRGGQPDSAHVRRKDLQPRQGQGQKITPLGGVDGVNLVDDDAGQVLEIEPRAFPGAEQGQLFRRGQ